MDFALDSRKPPLYAYKRVSAAFHRTDFAEKSAFLLR